MAYNRLNADQPYLSDMLLVVRVYLKDAFAARDRLVGIVMAFEPTALWPVSTLAGKVIAASPVIPSKI